jgi:hypothetical protein
MRSSADPMVISEPVRERLPRALRSTVANVVPRLLPETSWGDELSALLLFLWAHRRLPRRSGGGFNDALFWLKASGEIDDPLRVFVTDKEFVKLYVRAKLGEAYNVPTLAILRSPDEAAAYRYPDVCFIKPTHLSEHIILRRDGAPVDIERVRSWFAMNHYYVGREANYRHLQPKVIVEPLALGIQSPVDYKFLCVNGEPRIVSVVRRFEELTATYYTADWEFLPFGFAKPPGPPRDRPANLDQLLEVAAVLSRDFNLMRVDLYSDGRNVQVGELTNCMSNATGHVIPVSAERLMTRVLFGPGGMPRSLIGRRTSRHQRSRRDAKATVVESPTHSDPTRSAAVGEETLT